MPSITRWNRLEGRPWSEDLEESLAARVHDPLWMLMRQWQFGEWQAEDRASAVAVQLRGEAARAASYAPGYGDAAGGASPYDGGRLPLEVLVEREHLGAGSGSAPLRFAAEAGLHFWELLEAHGAAKYREPFLDEYPLTAPAQLDPSSRGYAAVMAGRVPDGAKLESVLRASVRPATGGAALPAKPAVATKDRARVLAAAKAWLTWLDEMAGPADVGGTAWVPERLEYAFEVGAKLGGDALVLKTPEYVEGHLDWYSFAVAAARSPLTDETTPDSTPLVRTLLPAPVAYPGMPASRWWQFEDGRIHFGAVEAGTRDLARLLLMEFALVYGNDFFIVPIDVEVGSLCRIDSLVVTDSFGERTLIRPSAASDQGEEPWRMFSLTQAPGVGGARPASPGELLFVPPVLGPSLHGPTIEEVVLMRDEMANLAWAVERVVESQAGAPLDRFEAYQAALTAAEAAAPEASNGAGPARYRLATSVPDHWLPLLPVRVEVDGGEGIRLRRGRVVEVDTGAAGAGPRGRLLQAAEDVLLHEEEVPRSGARVTRAYQYARWIDGSTHLWVGRRKGAGRGEGSSGLRFDDLEGP